MSKTKKPLITIDQYLQEKVEHLKNIKGQIDGIFEVEKGTPFEGVYSWLQGLVVEILAIWRVLLTQDYEYTDMNKKEVNKLSEKLKELEERWGSHLETPQDRQTLDELHKIVENMKERAKEQEKHIYGDLV
jgi:hypothetical protein